METWNSECHCMHIYCTYLMREEHTGTLDVVLLSSIILQWCRLQFLTADSYTWLWRAYEFVLPGRTASTRNGGCERQQWLWRHAIDYRMHGKTHWNVASALLMHEMIWRECSKRIEPHCSNCSNWWRKRQHGGQIVGTKTKWMLMSGITMATHPCHVLLWTIP